MSLAEAGSKSSAVGAAASPAAGPTAGPAAGAAEGEGAPRATVDVRQRWLLAVCCAAQFMVILDLSIVNVALPSIQSSLGFSTTQLQWVVDAYAIFFAGFLMIGGRAADYVGQRRTFVVALLLFSLTSLGGGLSVDHQMLVVARALQGVSAALMAATSLAIITSSFAAGPARHRAIGLWGAMNGAGGAAGTLLGGVITQELSWRWVLLINPPIGIAAAAVAYRVVAERRRDGAAPRFDLAGALTLTLGQLVLIYGVVTAAVHGWTSPDALVPIVAGAGLLALFGVIEMRFTSSPLVPLREITGSLKLANIIVLLFSAALFPMWYVSSLYLQQVLGLSPLATGFAFLPMALVIMLCASPRRQARQPLRRAGRARQRPGDNGERLAVVRSHRLERQRPHLRGTTGHLDRRRHRFVHRAFHDLCHPGRRACSGRAGFRPGKHIPPGRGRPWPGFTYLSRHRLHERSHRAQRRRPAGID